MNQLTILYVEDNKQLRDTICELLQSDARVIATCASAEEAFTLLATRHYDVLITDISLPGLSGTELTRRTIASRPDQWVVLCSGYELPPDLSKLGANVRSLIKPFEIGDLDAMLDEIASTVHRAESSQSALS
jgi:two-component system, cell cycle response regulator CpdR